MPEVDSARVKEIVADALAKPADERRPFIAAACGADASLRREVESLVGAAAAATNFLSSPTATAATAPPTEEIGTRIGPYKLLEKLGEGGFGAVFVAEQEKPLRRRVALKIIKLGMDTRQVVARFEQERQALAMMDHPNIARVLDAGATESGRPYFVMELVRGVPLTEYCDANNLAPRERLEIFVPVCNAVQHAHAKGIIHRDLKPSNILVTLHDGKPVPKVIDFGIAKAVHTPLTDKTIYTNLRQFIGTPAYTSPEQAEMSGLDVDTRADVYALGAILYELLTGTTPVKNDELVNAGFVEMQRIIREVDPPKPSTRVSTLGQLLVTVAAKRRTEPQRLGGLLRGDLDWIVMKALEKDRSRRYDTAVGLAQDVERHLNGEAVIAAPPSTGYRVRKFVRKHRKPVAAAAALALVVLVFGVACLALWLRADAERQLAEQRGYHASILAAEGALSGGQDARGREILELCSEAERNVEWSYLRAQADAPWRTFPGAHLRFSSDGQRALTIVGSEVRIWDLESGREVRALRGVPVQWACFSPDDRYVLGWNADDAAGELPVLWEVTSGAIVARLTGGQWPTLCTFSPDGSQVVVVREFGRAAKIFAIPSGKFLRGLSGHVAPITGTFFSPDGATLVTTSADGTARLYDGKGSFLRELRGHAGMVGYAAFVGASHIMTEGYDECVKLWNSATGTPIASWRAPGTTPSQVSPDGSRIAISSAEGHAVLYDIATSREIGRFGHHESPLACVRFSPDGSLLLTHAHDGVIQVHEIRTRRLAASIAVGPDVAVAGFTRDGRLIGTTFAREARSRVYRVDRSAGLHRRTVQCSAGDASFTFRMFDGGRRIVASSTDSIMRLWNGETGALIATLLPGYDVHFPVVSADGRRLLVFARLATQSSMPAPLEAWLVDGETGEAIKRLEADVPAPTSAAFSRDGASVATLSRDGEVHVWSAADGEQTRPPMRADQRPRFDLKHVTFEAGDRCLVAHNFSQSTGVVFNLETGSQIGEYSPTNSSGHGYQIADSFVTFSPMGSHFVSSSPEGEFAIQDTNSGDVRAVPGHPSGRPVRWANFSPDGSQLVTSDGATTHIWSVNTGTDLTMHDVCASLPTASSVNYSPDGVHIVAVMADGTINVREIDELGSEGVKQQFSGTAVSFVGFSPEGARYLTSTNDGSLQCWELSASQYAGPFREWPKAGPDGNVSAIAFDSHSSRIAVFWGATGRIFDLADPTREVVPFQAWGPVSSLRFVSDGRLLVARHSDGTIGDVWDTATGAGFPSNLSAPRANDSINGKTYSEDLSRVLVQTARGESALLDGATGELIAVLSRTHESDPAAAVSADLRTMITGTSRDGRAEVWDLDRGWRSLRLAGHDAGICAVATTPKGSPMITGSHDGRAIVWNQDGSIAASLRAHDSGVTHVAIDPSGHRVATGAASGEVKLWDVASTAARMVVVLTGHRDPISLLAFSPDGALVLSLSADSARIWRAADGAPVQVLAHPAPIACAAFDSAGRTLATGAADGVVRLWDTTTWKGTPLPSMSKGICHLAFAPSGKRMVTCAEDGMARIVDVESRAPISELHGHADGIIAAAFTSDEDESRLFTGSRDRTLKLWDTARGREVLIFARGAYLRVWVTPDNASLITLDEAGAITITPFTGLRDPSKT